MYRKSAAHKTLPLGTYVRVRNLGNQKDTVVRVNDRGPFVSGRIIDLSYASAKEIGLVKPGTCRTEITALGKEVGTLNSPLGEKPVVEISDPRRGLFTIQVGAFKAQKNALRLADRLKVIFDYVDVAIADDVEKGKIFRVRASKSTSLQKATEREKELKGMGFDDAFIVSL
jgi:rare lipoprotein A